MHDVAATALDDDEEEETTAQPPAQSSSSQQTRGENASTLPAKKSTVKARPQLTIPVQAGEKLRELLARMSDADRKKEIERLRAIGDDEDYEWFCENTRAIRRLAELDIGPSPFDSRGASSASAQIFTEAEKDAAEYSPSDDEDGRGRARAVAPSTRRLRSQTTSSNASRSTSRESTIPPPSSPSSPSSPSPTRQPRATTPGPVNGDEQHTREDDMDVDLAPAGAAPEGPANASTATVNSSILEPGNGNVATTPPPEGSTAMLSTPPTANAPATSSAELPGSARSTRADGVASVATPDATTRSTRAQAASSVATSANTPRATRATPATPEGSPLVEPTPVPNFDDLPEDALWIKELYALLKKETIAPGYEDLWARMLYDWVELERAFGWAYTVRVLFVLQRSVANDLAENCVPNRKAPPQGDCGLDPEGQEDSLRCRPLGSRDLP